METLFRVSHAAYYSKGVRERRIHRFNSISCSALFILLLLSFSQYAKAQIRLKTSQPVIQEKQTRTITQEFNLGGSDREIVELTISTTGVIEAKAEWSGTAGELALILNGPGRSQYYERRDGKSPLVLRYKVSRNLLSSGKTWKLSVVNFRSGTSAKGKVQINFIETAESEQAEEPLKEEGKRPGIKPVTEAVIKPVTEKRKFIQIKQYEVRESQGYNDQQLEGIKVQLEAQKIERTTVKLENRIKEIGPENPLVQIVVPLLYKSLEEQTEKPLIKNRINTSPHLASLIQSYKELSPSITGEYIHPRYSNLRAGQRIDRLQLGKDILEAIRPAYENEIRQMVRNSISPESLKFQWNTAVVRKSETPVVRPVRLQPDQKSIRELETLTNRLRINPTQDNLDQLQLYAQSHGFTSTEPVTNHISEVIAEKIGVQSINDWIPDLNSDHVVRNYYKYDVGLDWFYCLDQNERSCFNIFGETICSDDEPYWHLSNIVPDYDPNDPDEIHNLHKGQLYRVYSRLTDTYNDVNNSETRTFRSQDRWLLNSNIYNTTTTFTLGLWEEDWSKSEVSEAIHEAINDLRGDLASTIKAAVMDAVRETLYENLMETLPDELKGSLQQFFNERMSFSAFMEAVQSAMGGVDVNLIVLELIFSGENIAEIISGLGGICPEVAAVLIAIKVVGPMVIDLFEGDFQDAFTGLILLPVTLVEYIFDLLTNIVGFFENLMALCDPDDIIQNRSITIESSHDDIFQDASWGDIYSPITPLTPRGCGPRSGNSSLVRNGQYVQPYLRFEGADAEYLAYYNVLRTPVGGRETFGYTASADVTDGFIQTRTYMSKSRSSRQQIKVSYCNLNSDGAPLIVLTEKNGRATGSNLGVSEPEFYVNNIPGGEYELRIISIFGKDFYGYVTLEEK